VAEVENFLTLLLCDFPIGRFWYAESGIGGNFLPGIIECLLPLVPFQEPVYLLHHMFELAVVNVVQFLFLFFLNHMHLFKVQRQCGGPQNLHSYDASITIPPVL